MVAMRSGNVNKPKEESDDQASLDEESDDDDSSSSSDGDLIMRARSRPCTRRKLASRINR